MSDGHSRAQQPEASAAQPRRWEWVFLAISAIAGVVYLLNRKPKPRVFISFAFEDAGARNFLVRQSQFKKTPWTLEDGSLRVPFSERTWKRQVRPMIEGSDVLLLLIGSDTWRAKGAIWEVECARACGIPIVGMYIERDWSERGPVPACMADERIIDWNFDMLREVLAEFG